MPRLIVWGALFIFLGAAVTAGPAHVRPWVRWAVVLGVIALDVPAWIGVRALNVYAQQHNHFGGWGTILAEWRQLRPTVEYVAAGIVLMPLGMPLGRAVGRSSARRETRAWIKKLARARKRRLAA